MFFLLVSPPLLPLLPQVILDHGRHPHNFRIIEGSTGNPNQLVLQADGFNSLCGDRVNIYCCVTKGKDSRTSVWDGAVLLP